MITKSDFDAVHDRFIEEAGARLAPPTVEEYRDYMRGALSPENEEEFRERLFAYPEIEQILSEPFPEPAEPGDPDYLSEHEFARLWKAPRKAFPFWQAAAAALAVIAVLALFDSWRVRSQLDQPRAGALVILTGVARGGTGNGNTLYAGQAQTIYLRPEREYPSYRVTIESASHAIVWKSVEPLHKQEEAVTIFVPAHFLEPGDYDVVLYGLAGARQEELARNPVRVR